MSAHSPQDLRIRIEHGLIPAVPVPFTSSGEIDAAAHDRYVAWMSAQPVAGVAIWAHTGRGLRLSRAQRLQVLRSWASGLSSEKIIVAGVGGLPDHRADLSAYMNSALEMGRDAVENGAHTFLAHPPRLFHHAAPDREMVLNYHQQLASLGVPVILFYLYEAAGGILYTLEMLRALFALPEVVGIKIASLESVMTFQNITNLVAKEFPGKLVITGEDRFLGYSLMCGAQAALIGMGAACCALQHDLLRAHFDCRAPEFLELSRKVDQLSQVTFIPPMEGYIRRMLWALVHSGVIGMESAHDPWGPQLPESEFTELGRVLRELGVLTST